MQITELILLAIGLSMDAFAVAVCKGLAVCRVKGKHILLTGLWFGGFQALMPLIGYLLGSAFSQYIDPFDHWIAFILLALIGISMLREAFEKDCCDTTDASFAFRVMLVMAIATSIDALAVGITFSMLEVNILLAISLIGLITFAFSALGVKIGSIFGTRYRFAAELCGGILLILLGLKILLEGLFA